MKTKKLSNVEIALREQFHTGGYGLWIMVNKDGKRYVAKPVEFEFEEVSECFRLPDSTFQFTTKGDARTFLQDLSNELNNQGMKPNNDAVHGELKSIKIHLEDMRKLVFNK